MSRPIIRPVPRLQQNSNQRQNQWEGANTGAAAESPSSYGTASEPENLIDRQKRVAAARVLSSYEQLVWHATNRNEVALSVLNLALMFFPANRHFRRRQSIAQTRLHFEAILAGFSCAETRLQWPTEYQDTKTSHGKSSAAKVRAVSGSHGKDRTSTREGPPSSKKRDKDKPSTRSSGGT